MVAGARRRKRICLLGATGTIGRATAAALLRHGHDVICIVRNDRGDPDLPANADLGGGRAEVRVLDRFDAGSLSSHGLKGEQFDALISCMASRTGRPRDAWAVDHDAHMAALEAAGQAGIGHFLLLSAICVQKPRLAFQFAKLRFELALIESGIRYSIIRPTAYFKSLSGQIERLRQGKPFLIFGNGELTACKPISDEDLADYIVGCIDNESRWNKILPIGGPGPAITPRQQGEALFAMLGRPARFRSVPLAMLDAIIAVLDTLGRVVPGLANKAELARIGRYYATESMLVLNSETGRYEADATPSTGQTTLFDFYRAVLDGRAKTDLGDHAVF